ncbi:MAG: mevalonate kinase [Lysobacterales bacterium]
MSDTLHASAPGKLVIVGEYAVIYGAPALVSAVPRRATVSLRSRKDNTWMVSTPGLTSQGSDLPMSFTGVADATLPHQIPLLAAVFQSLDFQGPGYCAELDTQAFYVDHNSSATIADLPAKLGLGSSAAMCTALMGALALSLSRQLRTSPKLNTTDGQPISLLEVLKAHQLFQHGKGSGIDIAASYLGGCVEFRRDPKKTQGITHSPSILPVPAVWIWSGTSAATTSRLERLQQFQQAQPKFFTELMDSLSSLSLAACQAARQNQPEEFLEATGQFSARLANLDQCSQLGVWTDSHSKIADIARRCGVFYKTSGAGGGDCGLALDKDPDKLEYFRAKAQAGGFPGWHLGAENQGLTVA